MGIKSLLKLLEPIFQKTYIRQFAGKVLALDMSCFIHKGNYNGDVLKYLHTFIDYLTKLKCILILVFDGKPPFTKQALIDKRKANPYHFGITKTLVQIIIEEFEKLENVIIIKSPGESDPQLAYLSLNGLVDLIITDDSDLILYGCEKIAFKLNPRGFFMLYDKNLLPKCISVELPVFRWMCILSGCDYLPGGYKGLGLIKARKLMENLKPNPPYDETEIRKILATLVKADEQFIEDFLKAEDTFLHQNIYDPEENCIRPLFI